MRRGWLVAGGLWTALVLLAGSVAGWLWLAAPQLREEREQRIFPGAPRLRIDVNRGSVQLLAGDTAEVSVDRQLEWTKDKPLVQEALDGDVLSLRGQCPGTPGWRSAFTTDCAVRVTVRVPRSTAIEVTTAQAEVQVRDTTASVAVTTTTGAVALTNARGPVTVRTSTGPISGIDLAASTVEAITGTGAVQLSFGGPPQRVTARTRTGDLHITVPPGDQYRLLLGATPGRQTVRVGQDLNADRAIAAESTSGHVVVDHTAP